MFDTKCYELAEYFLADNGTATEEHKNELAQIIQDAIEDWKPTRTDAQHFAEVLKLAKDF